MDKLPQQERLEFVPCNGSFDIHAIAAAIARLGFSFRDDTDPTMFVVSPDSQSRDTFQTRRREDPESAFPYVLLIKAEPERITVWTSAIPGIEPLTTEFLRWLLASYRCRITNEEGTDVTAFASQSA